MHPLEKLILLAEKELNNLTTWYEMHGCHLSLEGGHDYIRGIILLLPGLIREIQSGYTEKLEETLRSIANHPHCTREPTWHSSPTPWERGYAIGVIDGHRCAAQIAKNSLPSQPPRTLGDAVEMARENYKGIPPSSPVLFQ